MKFFSSKRNSCFCAFCKTPRKLYSKKNIGIFHFLICLLLSLVMMVVFWQNFDPRFVVLFVSFMVASEIFVHLRWRVALVCRQCGFDPALYLKNPDKAVIKVKEHLEHRKTNPQFLLAPKLNLAYRKNDKTPTSLSRLPSVDADQNSLINSQKKIAASKKGRLVSKSI